MSETTARPPVEVMIHGICEGYAVEIGPLRLPIDQLAEACRRLAAAGITPAPTPSAAPANGSKPKVPKVPPQYDDQGNECCPVHGKVLKEGRYGLYCPAKDDAGRNGYCEYTHKP